MSDVKILIANILSVEYTSNNFSNSWESNWINCLFAGNNFPKNPLSERIFIVFFISVLNFADENNPLKTIVLDVCPSLSVLSYSVLTSPASNNISLSIFPDTKSFE